MVNEINETVAELVHGIRKGGSGIAGIAVGCVSVGTELGGFCKG